MTSFRSLLLAALLLAGCGSGNESAQQSPPPPPPVKDTAFGAMVGTMDKARAVEATTMEHKAEMDRKLEEQEGR